MISILSLLLQTTRNIALLPLCIPVLPSLAVFAATRRNVVIPKIRASSSYFPASTMEKYRYRIFQRSFRPPSFKIQHGFPREFPSLPILIPPHFLRRHICIWVKLDANVAMNYLRSNSRQRGLARRINLRDRTHTLSLSLDLLFIRIGLFCIISILFLFFFLPSFTFNREDNNSRIYRVIYKHRGYNNSFISEI